MESDTEGNTDEIRMEITSQFVKKHEYWERNGKNWIARTKGLDETYGYEGNFWRQSRWGERRFSF